jgi:hypothetical protein
LNDGNLAAARMLIPRCSPAHASDLSIGEFDTVGEDAQYEVIEGAASVTTAYYEQDPRLHDLNVLNEAKRLNDWNVLQYMEALLTRSVTAFQLSVTLAVYSARLAVRPIEVGLKSFRDLTLILEFVLTAHCKLALISAGFYNAMVAAYSSDLRARPEGLQKIYSILSRTNPKLSTLKPETILDSSFIQRIQSIGY